MMTQIALPEVRAATQTPVLPDQDPDPEAQNHILIPVLHILNRVTQGQGQDLVLQNREVRSIQVSDTINLDTIIVHNYMVVP